MTTVSQVRLITNMYARLSKKRKKKKREEKSINITDSNTTWKGFYIWTIDPCESTARAHESNAKIENLKS